ncbi:MAG: signal recognition particle-docking protein FtsY [Treponema sp.]|jgi:fused signal recognition particle receptor|nr:signal recognition particle-docking protein FtsY [Treponema sp.]
MNFAGKIKSFFTKAPAISDEFFEELSDLLVEGDIGAKEAFALSDLLRERCKKEKIAEPEQARTCLAGLLAGMLLTPQPFVAQNDRLTIILLLGVNGVGKTTTAAKLANLFQKNHGGRTVLAAADTFRAAAIDQLKIHGERLGLRVVAHQQGGDPAAVVYDAIEAAGSSGLVIADTAGRMHTKSALVDELRKIDRVVETKTAPAAVPARYIKYLVLDATTGRNAYAQAEIFCEAVSPAGAILTKYDSTAKGGVIFSLASGICLPVMYLCTGEQYGDIHPFDPQNFAREFAGIN